MENYHFPYLIKDMENNKHLMIKETCSFFKRKWFNKFSKDLYKRLINLKIMRNKKILYLYTGNHPVHRKFAESIGADIKEMSWKIPRDYNLYFSEGEFFKLIILRMIGKLNKDSKIINLFSDPRLFYLDKKIRFNIKKGKIERRLKIKTFIFKRLMNKLDGVICVGKFEESLLKKYYFGPFKRIDVFIDKDFHKKLLKIKPKLIERKVLFIGHGPDIYCKGIDVLIEVAKKNKNIDFIIIGRFYKKFIQNNIIPENVKFVGRLKNSEMCKVFKNNSLYAHLGRGESFGIAILEAMAAGLPCIVSKFTGAKEAVEMVNSKFVVPLNKKIISKKIIEYFNKSLKERQNLSKKFKERSKFYSEEKQLQNFKKQFETLVKSL